MADKFGKIRERVPINTCSGDHSFGLLSHRFQIELPCGRRLREVESNKFSMDANIDDERFQTQTGGFYCQNESHTNTQGSSAREYLPLPFVWQGF